MQTVTSRDGTRIACARSGAGPALLLVHGMIASHRTTWRYVLPLLARHFTVYAIDRRGRGASGDAPAYDLQREAEDIAAVVESSPAPMAVLGHSYGGLCALEAALLTPRMRRLIIYESVSPHTGPRAAEDVITQLDTLLAAGEVERLLETTLRDVVRLDDAEIALLRAQTEAWQIRIANAPTIPRELRAEARYRFEPARFRHLRTPAVLLVGGASAPPELANAHEVAAALPDARVVLLPGQQHLAMHTAPEDFARTIIQLLSPLAAAR